MNKTDTKQILIKIANDFLFDRLTDKNLIELSTGDLVLKIQDLFQEELKQFYLKTNFAKDIEKIIIKNSNIPSDEQALHLLARYSGGDNNNYPQISRQLPKFNKQYTNAGYECTLSTALIRLALEQLRYTNTRSVLLRRHYMAVRELPDGSIKFYDAANRTTINGQLHGFNHIFNPQEILNKKDVTKNQYTFAVKTKTRIKGTEVFSNKIDAGFYFKEFFAYDPSILIHFTVVLENLSQFKSQNDKYSIELCKKYPYLKKLDFKEMKKDLKLFDGYDYLR